MKSSVYDISVQQKELIHKVRNEFFDALIEEWTRHPEEVDKLMGQEDCFYLPDFKSKLANLPQKEVMIKDVERGLLAVSVTPTDEHGNPQDTRWVYSIMQAGDWLRYGVLIQGPARKIYSYAQHQEYTLSIEKIWDRPCDNQLRDAAGLLLEWRFEEPTFYDQFVCRERFIIIARHLHFRLGRIVQTVVQEQEMESYRTKDEDLDDFSHENFGE